LRRGKAAQLNIINAIRHFPADLKKADDILLPKLQKDPLFPQNYRPIGLLPFLGKVAEVIILRRLKEEEENLHVIPDEQFGFSRTVSTQLQVLRMTEYITEGFNRKEATEAVLLDVSKAFDRVWHRGLLIKMLDAGFSVGLVKLTRSFLSVRRFQVKTDSIYSSYREMEAGVPQGAVLSPFLYNIYVSDPPRTQRSSLALYADNTGQIMARSRRGRLLIRYLQEETTALEKL